MPPSAARIAVQNATATATPVVRSVTKQPPTLIRQGKTLPLADLKAQVAAVLLNAVPASDTGDAASTLQAHLRAQRQRRVVRLYRELAAAGCELADVHQLRAHHATALLDFWKAQGRASSTIRSDWSALRGWCAMMGAPQLVEPLQVYVPGAGRGRTRDGATRHTDRSLIALLALQADRTHYMLEVLCQVARISVREALLLDPRSTGQSGASRAACRLMAACAKEPRHAEFLLDLRDFLLRSGRPTLLWQGTCLARALRRHDNRLAYLRRAMRAGTIAIPPADGGTATATP